MELNENRKSTLLQTGRNWSGVMLILLLSQALVWNNQEPAYPRYTPALLAAEKPRKKWI